MNIAVTKFYEEISKLVPQITVVTAAKITPQTTTISPQGVQIDTSVDASKAFYTAMSQACSHSQDRHIVAYAISDDDIVGIHRALTTAGRQDDAMMSGFGCDAHAVEGLRTNPAWVGESPGSSPTGESSLLAISVAVKNGAETPPTTFSPAHGPSHEDTVDDYFDPGSTTPKAMAPLPDVQYLAETGVLEKFGNVEGLK